MTSLSKRITKLEAMRAVKGVRLPTLVYSITDKQGHSCGQYRIAIAGKFGVYRSPTPDETLRITNQLLGNRKA